jgi:gamma-glutamyltranspeptidase/glutathione hydrolase
LFEPAITLAEDGFVVGRRLHTLLAAEQALKAEPGAAAYFYRPDGAPWPVGHRLRNPALAEVLRQIAARGSVALHEGPVAADIVSRVRGHPTNPGRLTVADLAGYAPLLREPICTAWRARWQVCGFPPPSSGHLAMMQILGLLEHAGAPAPLQDGVPSAGWLHVYAEASRLAFADRALYVADPDFTRAPGGDWRRMLDSAYLAQRAALIGPLSMKVAAPGRPGGEAIAAAPMPAQPARGTSHLSVVDAEGHAVALTSSIEAAWGARLFADGGTGLPGGFLLNNQLTDFSFTPAGAEGRPVANRVQPGKRPRSSMSPTLVFDLTSGRLLLVAGSPGGAGIIHFTAKALLATLDWGIDAQAAAGLPNFGSFNGPTVLESGRFPAATLDALRARGHVVQEVDLTSGVHLVQRTPQGWSGGADPRREGVAVGD